jgi:hypothetical protein
MLMLSKNTVTFTIGLGKSFKPGRKSGQKFFQKRELYSTVLFEYEGKNDSQDNPMYLLVHLSVEVRGNVL